MISDKIARLREEYKKGSLSIENMLEDPFDQFQLWFDEMLDGGVSDSNAMTLATASSDGQPSARTVLMKDIDHRGVVFYCNYNSLKGQQLEENPKAALLFYWKELERQIRIEGEVEKVPAEESDYYFMTRPFESRLSAVISPQSTVIPNRDFLLMALDAVRAEASEELLKRPEFWGGYRLVPHRFEFWQG